MKSSVEIPKRLWAVIRPDTFEVIGLEESHTAEEACGAIARQLGWQCEAFFLSWLPGPRRAEEEGQAVELIAANVTALVASDARLESVQQLLEEREDEIESERYIARSLD